MLAVLHLLSRIQQAAVEQRKARSPFCVKTSGKLCDVIVDRLRRGPGLEIEIGGSYLDKRNSPVFFRYPAGARAPGIRPAAI